MSSPLNHPYHRILILAAVALLGAACSDATSLPPSPEAQMHEADVMFAKGATDAAIVQLRNATAQYRDVNVAIADGFVLLHGCEERPDGGTVGALFVHFGRLTDGQLDPALPDALLYEPGSKGRMTLVGVEFAMPYAMWSDAAPPSLFGTAFHEEDEFGVYALHAWVWRHNPDGLFAEANPRVFCEP